MTPEVQKLIDQLEKERGESDYARSCRLIREAQFQFSVGGFRVGDFVFVPSVPSFVPANANEVRRPLVEEEIALGVVAHADPLPKRSLFDTAAKPPHVIVVLPTGAQAIRKSRVVGKAIGLSIETRYDLLIALDAYLVAVQAAAIAAAQAAAKSVAEDADDDRPPSVPPLPDRDPVARRTAVPMQAAQRLTAKIPVGRTDSVRRSGTTIGERPRIDRVEFGCGTCGGTGKTSIPFEHTTFAQCKTCGGTGTLVRDRYIGGK